MAEAQILSTERLTPYQRWEAEITAAEEELKKFHERARRVTKKFLDDRDASEASAKWFNIFYANTNILESSLYAQLPKPIVSRKFKDSEDDIARVAALIIERGITQDLDDPRDNFDAMMRHCVQDRLVPGLSQAWLRLETDVEEVEPITEGEPGAETDDEEPTKRITDQRVVIDYVFWEDFLWSPCRVWEERRWTGRKVYLTREKLIKRFGEEKGKKVPLKSGTVKVQSMTYGSTPVNNAVETACIYEIWDRDKRKVIWLCKGYDTLLDEIDDPLKLTGFEPCPKPMLANCSTSNTVPRPDYYMLQDQYTELDRVNNRISMLIQACKVVGVYDKSATGIQRMLSEGFDNQLIPVDNWAMFAEKQGLKGAIDWLPLETVVLALQRLNEAREAIKSQIYELTGISDIVRGATKASETLGAQEIKSKFASIRIKKLQDEVATFAMEVMRIKAELMIKHFAPEILLKKSNIQATGNDQFIEPALQLLQSDEGFEWRIEISADSIAQADYAMEKADRIEFLTSVSGYLQNASQMFQTVPESATFLVGMLKWACAGFRNAAEIEGMLDRELDRLQKSSPSSQDKPDPEAEKAKAEQQRMQAEQQMAQQKAQVEQQVMQQKAQIEAQAKQADLQIKQQLAQLDVQMKQAEFAHQQRLNEMEMRMREVELQFKEREMLLDMQTAQVLAKAKASAAKETGDSDD